MQEKGKRAFAGCHLERGKKEVEVSLVEGRIMDGLWEIIFGVV